MAQTRVDSFFFDGNLSAAEVSRRVGQEASPASSLPMENSRAATKRLAWANGGMSTVFVPYKSPVDRLRGLPMTLWRNRDIQYVKDIAEIRIDGEFLISECQAFRKIDTHDNNFFRSAFFCSGVRFSISGISAR